MKNYLIALFFAIGLASMQSASASTMTSLEVDNGTVIGFDGSINGSFSTGFHLWELKLSEASNVTFTFDTPYFAFDTSPSIFEPTPSFTRSLIAGSYGFHLLGLTDTNKFSIMTTAFTPGAVPVPGAIWLFGSALAGLIGVTSRKSSSSIAAA